MLLFDTVTQTKVEAYILSGADYPNSPVFDAFIHLSKYHDHLFLKQESGKDVHVSPQHSNRYVLLVAGRMERIKLYDSDYKMINLMPELR